MVKKKKRNTKAKRSRDYTPADVDAVVTQVELVMQKARSLQNAIKQVSFTGKLRMDGGDKVRESAVWLVKWIHRMEEGMSINAVPQIGSPIPESIPDSEADTRQSAASRRQLPEAQQTAGEPPTLEIST